MNLVNQYISYIIQLCRNCKVKYLYVFGSVLTNRFREDSDVDFLVSFDKSQIPLEDYADNFFNLQFGLEEIFKRNIDLVCYDSISNPVFLSEVESTKQLVYAS